MERLPEKLQNARIRAHISQTELAERVGVSRRSIFAYESGGAMPRKDILRKLAAELYVTVEYLLHDEIDDPDYGRAREDNMNKAYDLFGSKGKHDVAGLMEKNLAFLAGGDIPQEDKDAFFDVMMSAYVAAKERAREKFTPKSVKENKKSE